MAVLLTAMILSALVFCMRVNRIFADTAEGKAATARDGDGTNDR